VLGVALGAYYAFTGELGDLSTRWELAFLALCLIPAVFALVWLALPFRRLGGRLLVAALAFLVLAVVFELAGLEARANFAKLALMTALGFWFLSYFESVLWVALVALVIPLVDSFSVWRGPTRHIVEEQPQVFDVFSFAFPSPGGESSANLGLPDLLFFALFLAAAARWNLRVGWTWIALTLSLGATMLLAVEWGVAGLPALPGLAFGFLIPNADLLWREFQRWHRSRR
jgi:Na+/H+-dicarboxylate symporter